MVPGLLQVLFSPIIQESPQFLLMNKNDKDASKKCKRRFIFQVSVSGNALFFSIN